MEISGDTIKTATPFIAPFVSLVIETWIKPKLNKLIKEYDADKDVIENAFNTKFEEYISRSYKKYSNISVLIFHNQDRSLEDLYIPMTVVASKRNLAIKIDDFRDDFLPKHKKVLITDTAGMGKSTLMKFLFLTCLKKNQGIPIFIDLRKLDSKNSVLTHIAQDLNPIDDEFNKEFILKLIRKGDFIFFLDGFDEISFEHKAQVTSDIQDFISKAGNNQFIITSRPENALNSFSGFSLFHMQPLAITEAFTLIRKYDDDGDLSKELINKLQGDTLKSVKEFLANPLLVSLLYKAYDFKHSIPFKKHIFYRQVYDSLFENHDLTKGDAFARQKHCRLDIEDFHTVLRCLGYLTMKAGRVEYGRDELLQFIKETKAFCSGLEYKESLIFKDILVTVPVFVRDGDYYRWSHKSLQDYFAAQFICIDAKSHQENLLRQMHTSEANYKYINVLDLCYDIDHKTFRRVVVYDIVNAFIEHYDNSFKYTLDSSLTAIDLHNRKVATFARNHLIIPKKQMNTLKSTRDFYNLFAQCFNIKLEIETSGMLRGRELHNCTLVSCLSQTFNILELLQQKNEMLFTNDLEFFVQAEFPKSSKTTFSTKKLITVSENSSSESNNKSNFKKINHLILSMSPYIPLLDIGKCRDLKKDIEKELEREKYNGIYTL